MRRVDGDPWRAEERARPARRAGRRDRHVRHAPADAQGLGSAGAAQTLDDLAGGRDHAEAATPSGTGEGGRIAPPLPQWRHVWSVETKQSTVAQDGLDCFAALAMTTPEKPAENPLLKTPFPVVRRAPCRA